MFDHLEVLKFQALTTFCDLFRLQEEIGLRQDTENNLNTFRQVTSVSWTHDLSNLYIQFV